MDTGDKDGSASERVSVTEISYAGSDGTGYEAAVTLSLSTLHEVSNHLTIVIATIDVLLHDSGEADPRRDDLEEIRRAARAAAALLMAPAQSTTG